jgi:serine/threonine protein phosphatase PrpC
MNTKAQFLMETDVGLSRSLNEDNGAYDNDLGVFVIADGMGGHQAGEIASAMATHLSLEALGALAKRVQEAGDVSPVTIKNTLLKIIEDINEKIFSSSQENASHQGMGTTLVIGIVIEQVLHYAHVGDSRLYMYRRQLLTLLTQDHTLLQEMLNKSVIEDQEKVYETVPGNIITQALGVKDTIAPDYDCVRLEKDDAFFATTDGIHDALDHEEFEELAKEVLVSDKLQLLIDRANQNSGRDNSTVLMMKVKNHKKWLLW